LNATKMPVGNYDRRFRGVFAGFIPITLLVVIVSIGLYVYLSQWVNSQIAACQAAILRYPGAVLVSEEERSIRPPFGPVETRLQLVTTDDAATVEDWYSRSWGEIAREASQSDPRNYSAPPRGWDISVRADGGSIIRILAVCPTP